jgi:hypothetical protein
MSTTSRPTEQYAGQGWVLFDWDYHASRPQLTFRAGNMDATRMQFDAYRRFVHIPQWAAQVQLWCWSQNDFRIQEIKRTGSNPVLVNTWYPQAWPDSVQTVAGAAVREYRFPGLQTWTQGSYQNNYTSTAKQMTIAGRWFGVFDFATTTQQTFQGPDAFDPYGIRLDFEQPGTKSTIRVLALGHHNHVWQTGGIA